jgi:hypothetical protein
VQKTHREFLQAGSGILFNITFTTAHPAFCLPAEITLVNLKLQFVPADMALRFSGKRFRIPKSEFIFSQPLYNLVQPLVQRQHATLDPDRAPRSTSMSRAPLLWLPRVRLCSSAITKWSTQVSRSIYYKMERKTENSTQASRSYCVKRDLL